MLFRQLLYVAGLIYFILFSTHATLSQNKTQDSKAELMLDYYISTYENYDFDDYDEKAEAIFNRDVLESHKMEFMQNAFDKFLWFGQLWNDTRPGQTSIRTRNKSPEKLTDNSQSINKFVQNYLFRNNFDSDLRHGFDFSIDSLVGDYSDSVSRCTEEYCDIVADYPRDAILKALKKTSELYLHNDRLASFGTNLRAGVLSDDNSNDIALCESSEYLIYPKTAKNINNDWNYVVNIGSHTQSIRVEKCKKVNSPCHIVEGFRLGYETYCKQKYMVRELITFDNTTGLLGKQSFAFPASCCCSGRMNFMFSYLRNAKAETNNRPSETSTEINMKEKITSEIKD